MSRFTKSPLSEGENVVCIMMKIGTDKTSAETMLRSLQTHAKLYVAISEPFGVHYFDGRVFASWDCNQGYAMYFGDIPKGMSNKRIWKHIESLVESFGLIVEESEILVVLNGKSWTYRRT